MNARTVDRLLDEVDSIEREQLLLYNPIYASPYDLEDPFLVVVHQTIIGCHIRTNFISEGVGQRVNSEIERLKSKYSWTRAGPNCPADVLWDPVLVCGALEEVCVRSQYENLIRAGHETYISEKGVLSLYER